MLSWKGNARDLFNHIIRLKIAHPVGDPVTEEVLKQLNAEDYPPGLDEHTTYTSRRYHVLFYQALQYAIDNAKSPKEIANKMIDRVMETDRIYFEDPSDRSMKQTRDNISQNWQTHKRDCDVCTLVWKQRRLK